MTAAPEPLLDAVIATPPCLAYTGAVRRLADCSDGMILASWRDRVQTPSGLTVGLGTVVHAARLENGLDIDLSLCSEDHDQGWSVILETGVSLISDTPFDPSAPANEGRDGRILISGSTGVLADVLGAEFVGICGVAYSAPRSIGLGDRTARIEGANGGGALVFCRGAAAGEPQQGIRFRSEEAWSEWIDLT